MSKKAQGGKKVHARRDGKNVKFARRVMVFAITWGGAPRLFRGGPRRIAKFQPQQDAQQGDWKRKTGPTPQNESEEERKREPASAQEQYPAKGFSTRGEEKRTKRLWASTLFGSNKKITGPAVAQWGVCLQKRAFRHKRNKKPGKHEHGCTEGGRGHVSLVFTRGRGVTETGKKAVRFFFFIRGKKGEENGLGKARQQRPKRTKRVCWCAGWIKAILKRKKRTGRTIGVFWTGQRALGGREKCRRPEKKGSTAKTAKKKRTLSEYQEASKKGLLSGERWWT